MSSQSSFDLRQRIRAINLAERDRDCALAKGSLVARFGDRHASLIHGLPCDSAVLRDIRYMAETYSTHDCPVDRGARVLLRSRVEVLLEAAESDEAAGTAEIDPDALAALLEDVLASLDCL